MGSFFNPENRLFRALGIFADMMILNFYTILLCIPIVTAGAAFSAMHYCLLHLIRGEESYITKMFFREFARNFKSATPLWLLMVLFGVLSWVDIRILGHAEVSIPAPVRYLFLVTIALLVLLGQYVMPLVSRYHYRFREYLANSALLALGYLPRTVLAVAAEVVWFVGLFYFWQYIAPLYLMVGFTGIGMIRAGLYNGIFKKLEGEGGEDGGESGTGESERLTQEVTPLSFGREGREELPEKTEE